MSHPFEGRGNKVLQGEGSARFDQKQETLLALLILQFLLIKFIYRLSLLTSY